MVEGKLSSREMLIVEHARWYRDVVDPCFSAHGQGSGGGVTLMPLVYTRSFKEFERCNRELRRLERNLWYSFHERFMASLRVQKVVKRRGAEYLIPANWSVLIGPAVGKNEKKRKHAQLVDDANVVVEIWREGINLDRAYDGVRWIAAHFEGEPCLPKDIWEMKAA